MPIFFKQDIDDNTKLAIWKIEEQESFFLLQVPLQREITHPHKRLQHLAGRYLLKYLFPDFPVEVILIADTRKPFLENEAYHFSISHCRNYAAAIVSKVNRVGVDIETVSEKIERIRNKFISYGEWEILNVEWNKTTNQLVNLTTLIWSCKEAVFKWYGLGAIDFKEHIKIKSIIQVADDSFESIVIFNKNEDLFLDLHSCFFNALCLSWVVT